MVLGSAAGLRVGIFLPYESAPAEFGRLAEDAGFDLLAYGEHVLFRRPIYNAFVALAAAAGATRRIRLLSALTLLPLYPAALAAKLVTSLDAISDGRFEFGVGIGGEVPAEFEVCGVDVTRRGRLTDEALVVIKQFLMDPVRDGARSMLPGPRQQPGPRIWIGGRSDWAIARAAREGDGWLPYLVTAEQLEASVAKLHLRRQQHRPQEAIKTGVVCFVAIDADSVRAQRDARSFVSSLYDLDERRAERYAIGGDPPQVAARLAELRDAGADAVILNLCAEGEAADAMAVLAGAELIPALAMSTSHTERW